MEVKKRVLVFIPTSRGNKSFPEDLKENLDNIT